MWPRRWTEPLSAAVYTGAHACQKLPAMAQADVTTRAAADQLAAAAGEVDALAGFHTGAGEAGRNRARRAGLRERGPGAAEC